MAALRLQNFSQPAVLHQIDRQLLLGFLSPFRPFLRSRGIELPKVNSGGVIDFERLTGIFVTPNEQTPRELLDALYLVDEMATEQGMEALVIAASLSSEIRLPETDDLTPADIAILFWLKHREVLEQKHAEQFFFKSKTFDYFQAEGDQPPRFKVTPQAAAEKIQSDLDDWFAGRQRGRGTRVFMYSDDHQMTFLVRHGQTFKREESLVSGKASSVCYRPLKYDVIVYDLELGELRINAQLVGEKKIYRRLIGQHLFGNENCFPGIAKFTLEPLRELGGDALSCGDVDGIESILLTELHLNWSTTSRDIEILKSDDVFSAMRSRKRSIPKKPRMMRAIFKLKFLDAKAPRTVELRPSNIAVYSRDGDAPLVEQWLTLRGFSSGREIDRHVPSAVAGA